MNFWKWGSHWKCVKIMIFKIQFDCLQPKLIEIFYSIYKFTWTYLWESLDKAMAHIIVVKLWLNIFKSESSLITEKMMNILLELGSQTKVLL